MFMALSLIGPLGTPEIIVLLFTLPQLAAVVWALWTLYRIRVSQTDLEQRLAKIEELLRRTASS